jgi:hypothetical protein
MGKMTKTLLALSLTALGSGLLFSSGLINVVNFPALYVALPAGAILFGLFLISLMLEKESDKFDREHNQAAQAAAKISASEDTRPQQKQGAFVPAKAV